MPEQGGLPKPGDLFIGVVEFFAVLVPGIIAVTVIGWTAGLHVPEKQDFLFFGAILVAGYVLGHVLHGLGSCLDFLLYDPLFKPLDEKEKAHHFRRWSYFRANDKLYRAARRVATSYSNLAAPSLFKSGTKIGTGSEQLPTGMYQWARAWLRMHSADATTELNRIEADSKLFRSLSILALLMLICWKTLPPLVSGFLPWLVVMLVVCLWRYCDLRQKMVRACYLHFVLLHSDHAQIDQNT